MQKSSIKTPFDEFQLEEYKNISNSHFESIKQVSVFFRYYLLILAAPIVVFNFISNSQGGIQSFLGGKQAPIYYDIAFSYLVLVSLIGLFIFFYVVNLRHDAILYAKSVNKVRRYFYENSSLLIDEYEQYLTLPIVSTEPKYSQKTFFLPLLMVFSIINCGLLYFGLKLKLLKTPYFGSWHFALDFPLTNMLIYVLASVFFLAHIMGYYYLCYKRNSQYLKHYSFGVDIDGVLNNQTSHFVEWLRNMTGMQINSEDIKEIPVSLNGTLGVSDSDEKLVFNSREYWETLPVKLDAAKRINDFQKRFGYNVFFFSYRAWPQYGNDEMAIRQRIIEKGYTPLNDNEIFSITSKWLQSVGIEAMIVDGFISNIKYRYNRLFKGVKKVVIEMGNPFISDNRYWNRFQKAIRNNNRFQGANLKGFRFFIEDTAENAIKLSVLCDYVFMFDEPYNKEIKTEESNAADIDSLGRKFKKGYTFPKNVIRVSSWDDIYRHLKYLS